MFAETKLASTQICFKLKIGSIIFERNISPMVDSVLKMPIKV